MERYLVREIDKLREKGKDKTDIKRRKIEIEENV